MSNLPENNTPEDTSDRILSRVEIIEIARRKREEARAKKTKLQAIEAISTQRVSAKRDETVKKADYLSRYFLSWVTSEVNGLPLWLSIRNRMVKLMKDSYNRSYLLSSPVDLAIGIIEGLRTIVSKLFGYLYLTPDGLNLLNDTYSSGDNANKKSNLVKRIFVSTVLLEAYNNATTPVAKAGLIFAMIAVGVVKASAYLALLPIHLTANIVALTVNSVLRVASSAIRKIVQGVVGVLSKLIGGSTTAPSSTKSTSGTVINNPNISNTPLLAAAATETPAHHDVNNMKAAHIGHNHHSLVHHIELNEFGKKLNAPAPTNIHTADTDSEDSDSDSDSDANRPHR